MISTSSAFSRINEKSFNIMVDFTFSGLFSAYQSGFHSQYGQSIEEISRISGTLCFEGINELKKDRKEKKQLSCFFCCYIMLLHCILLFRSRQNSGELLR